jgi:hypothetical protein
MVRQCRSNTEIKAELVKQYGPRAAPEPPDPLEAARLDAELKRYDT